MVVIISFIKQDIDNIKGSVSKFNGKYQDPFTDMDLLRYDDYKDENVYVNNGFNYIEDDAFFPLQDVKDTS